MLALLGSTVNIAKPLFAMIGCTLRGKHEMRKLCCGMIQILYRLGIGEREHGTAAILRLPPKSMLSLPGIIMAM